MTTTAVTYRTGESSGKLRTVIVEDARTVVLATGGLELLAAKLLHGTRCACSFWDEELGTSGDDFVIEASQVVAQRPMTVGVKAVHKEA
jgi:hypothetical protein